VIWPGDHEPKFFRRQRASSAASVNSQSRKVAIFGFAEVALGHTIQYVLPVCPGQFQTKIERPDERPFCDGTSAALIARQDIRQFSNAWCREDYHRQHEEPGKRPGLKPMPYERPL